MASARIADVLRELTREQVEFIVVGMASAVLQGAPLMTLDLDFVHRRTNENVQRLLRVLDRIGARYRGDPRNLPPTASHLIGPGHQLLSTTLGDVDALGSIDGDRTRRHPTALTLQHVATAARVTAVRPNNSRYSLRPLGPRGQRVTALAAPDVELELRLAREHHYPLQIVDAVDRSAVGGQQQIAAPDARARRRSAVSDGMHAHAARLSDVTRQAVAQVLAAGLDAEARPLDASALHQDRQDPARGVSRDREPETARVRNDRGVDAHDRAGGVEQGA